MDRSSTRYTRSTIGSTLPLRAGRGQAAAAYSATGVAVGGVPPGVHGGVPPARPSWTWSPPPAEPPPGMRRCFVVSVHRIAHISDLHHQVDWRQRSLRSSGWRGAPGRFELHGMGRLKRFDGVHDRIRRLVDQVGAQDPDLVLLTGDLSALGDTDEIAAV